VGGTTTTECVHYFTLFLFFLFFLSLQKGELLCFFSFHVEITVSGSLVRDTRTICCRSEPRQKNVIAFFCCCFFFRFGCSTLPDPVSGHERGGGQFESRWWKIENHFWPRREEKKKVSALSPRCFSPLYFLTSSFYPLPSICLLDNDRL
jgi:hypothetical protein